MVFCPAMSVIPASSIACCTGIGRRCSAANMRDQFADGDLGQQPAALQHGADPAGLHRIDRARPEDR